MAGISMSLPSMRILTNWLWSIFEQKAVSIVHESCMTKYWIPEWEKHSLIFQTICPACPKYVHFFLQRKVLSPWGVNRQSWPDKLALLCWAIHLFSCCFVSPMYRSMHSSLYWTAYTRLLTRWFHFITTSICVIQLCFAYSLYVCSCGFVVLLYLLQYNTRSL